MPKKTYDIETIAAEFDRLFPDQVDATPVAWGYGTVAGHIGHHHEDRSIVGWFSGGGSDGHPVLAIANADIQRAGELLAGMVRAESLDDIERAFAAAGVRYERLV